MEEVLLVLVGGSQSILPHTKDFQSPNANSAKVEGPAPILQQLVRPLQYYFYLSIQGTEFLRVLNTYLYGEEAGYTPGVWFHPSICPRIKEKMITQWFKHQF